MLESRTCSFSNNNFKKSEILQVKNVLVSDTVKSIFVRILLELIGLKVREQLVLLIGG